MIIPSERNVTTLNILHIIQTVDPRSGGPIEGILRSSETLLKLGHQRTLVCLDRPTASWLKEFPLPILALGKFTDATRKKWGWLPWIHYGYSPEMRRWLKSNANNFDVVIVNGLWNYSTRAARQVLVKSGIRYFVFTHGMLDPWFRRAYPLKTFFKQISWFFNEGPLLAGAQGVLFTSEEERILARNAFWPYRANEVVVGYGTKDVSGPAQTQQTLFRKLLPELGERRFLLFLSRIHPKKGCDLLIDAFATIAPRFPEIDLVIAGPDHDGWITKLKQQAADCKIAHRIHWPGMLSGDEKWGAFHACDAFTLPSHQENFGIVVAEALACGKIVLITNKVNIWQEIQKGDAGLVGEDDQMGFTEVLKEYLSLSQERKEEMQRHARSTFVLNFDIDKNISKLVNVLTNSQTIFPSTS